MSKHYIIAEYIADDGLVDIDQHEFDNKKDALELWENYKTAVDENGNKFYKDIKYYVVT